MSSKQKIPKDLGVKVGSETEVMWTQVRDGAKLKLRQAEGDLILQKAVIELAENKISVEKRKFK